MNLQRIDPAADSASVDACYQIYLAAHPIDDPNGPARSARSFAHKLAKGWAGDPQEVWLDRDSAGLLRGWYTLSLPYRENRHLALLWPTVRPDCRRSGLGSALVRHAASRASASGRTTLAGQARDGSPGSAFASSLGARRGLTFVVRVLRLPGIPAGRLPALRAQAEPAAHGYELLSWDGPAPDEWVAGLAAINAQGFADLPRDPGEEPMQWDEARVRLDEDLIATQGLRWYTVAARTLASGELAAFSQLIVDPADPSWGFQELTAVARPHRGHRLGLLVKVAMLELLAEREPQLTRVITGNADANEHMIAINAKLGFEVLDQWPSWELDVAQARTVRSHAVSVTS